MVRGGARSLPPCDHRQKRALLSLLFSTAGWQGPSASLSYCVQLVGQGADAPSDCLLVDRQGRGFQPLTLLSLCYQLRPVGAVAPTQLVCMFDRQGPCLCLLVYSTGKGKGDVLLSPASVLTAVRVFGPLPRICFKVWQARTNASACTVVCFPVGGFRPSALILLPLLLFCILQGVELPA